MRCGTWHSLIHEYLDGELNAQQEAEIEEHLTRCPACSDRCDEYSAVSQLMTVPVRLSESSSDLLYQRIRRKIQLTYRQRLAELVDTVRIGWRDMDSRKLWAKLAAVPLTVLFFSTLMPQIQHRDFLNLPFPVFSTQGSRMSQPTPPMVQVVNGRQELDGFNRMLHVVNAIPYEDQTAVLLGIDQGGKVAIDGILEQPKNPRMLEAIDESVKTTRFGPQRESRQLIHYFLKIDVYESPDETRRGM